MVCCEKEAIVSILLNVESIGQISTYFVNNFFMPHTFFNHKSLVLDYHEDLYVSLLSVERPPLVAVKQLLSGRVAM